MPATRMVPLVAVHEAFHARVIAARLGSDGILTELRGDLAGPYPLPGEVRIYVEEADLAVARQLLVADPVDGEVDLADGADGATGDEGPGVEPAVAGGRVWPAVVAVVVLVVCLLATRAV